MSPSLHFVEAVPNYPSPQSLPQAIPVYPTPQSSYTSLPQAQPVYPSSYQPPYQQQQQQHPIPVVPVVPVVPVTPITPTNSVQPQPVYPPQQSKLHFPTILKL